MNAVHSRPGPGADAATFSARALSSEAEAIATAHELAAIFRAGAAERDRDRRLPAAELDQFSASGLWGITVPKRFGGLESSYATVAEVIRVVSAADPCIGQIPQNHLGVVQAIRTTSDEAQQALLFEPVLRGVRFGNAFSEFGSRDATVFETTIRPSGNGFVVRGRKFYSSGALLAHLVPIAATDAEGRAILAIADRHAPGLTIVDDWSSFGQRTTASGTVIIEDVFVPASHVVPAWRGYERPSIDGPVSQIIQAAVDAGIAHGAIEDLIAFVRTRSRPWIDSGQDRAAEDVYTIRDVGDLKTRLHAAEALLERAGRVIDDAAANRNAATVGGGLDRGRRSQDPDHRDRHSGDQQAVRAGRHAFHPGRAQSRPALAQCAHPHAARSGAVEIPCRRSILSQRHAAAAPCLDLKRRH